MKILWNRILILVDGSGLDYALLRGGNNREIPIRFRDKSMAIPLKMSIFAYINTLTDTTYGSYTPIILRLYPLQSIH